MIVLEFRAGPNAGQRVALQRTAARIGGAGSHVVVIDPDVSSPHCEILLRDGQHYLVDLGSATGTRIGGPSGAPIPPHTPVPIMPGAVIWVGRTSLELSELRADRTAKVEPRARPQTAPAAADATAPMRMVAPARDATEISGVIPGARPAEARGRGPAPADTQAMRVPAADTQAMPRSRGPSFEDAPDDPPTAVMHERSEIRADARAPSDAVVIEPLGPDDDPGTVYAPYDNAAYLTFTAGPHAGRRVYLGEQPATLGRGDASTVVLSDPMVELHHATVARVRRSYAVVPANSRTVVRVNSERILEPRPLATGDIFTLGASDVSFTEAGVDLDALDAASTVAVQDPFFAYSGQVRRQRMLTLGRSPDADLFLDHHRVEREHVRLVYRYPDFYLEDLSAEGTYLNGERAHDELLSTGDEIRIGGYKIRLQIQPLRCSLDIVPPPDDEEVPRFAPDVDAAASYQTLYHLPSTLGKKPAPAAAPVRKDRSTVLWVEPFDVKRSWRNTIMVGVAAAMSILVVVLVAMQGGQSFLRRPLAEGHRSPEFAAALESKAGGADTCAGCHGSFEARVTTSCTQCHAQDAHPLRPGHARDETIAQLGCTACHGEHLTETGAPQLIEGERCASAGCHVSRHAQFFPQTAGPTTRTATGARAVARRAAFGVDLLADVAFDHGQRKTRIHQIHLARGLEGQCGACHAVGDEERPTGAAWQSCFTCHGPREASEAMASQKCSECHREHGESAEWAAAPAQAGALSARGTGQLAFLLLLLPVGLVLVFHHVVLSRRKFLTHVVEEEEKKKTQAQAPAEEMLCDGVAAGEATQLPRLIESKCVGSADCVAACPYQVLEMVPGKQGKPAHPVVARPELCHECGSCVAVCGPGALVMMEPGQPFPLVDRPAVDANYETSIPGSKGGVYVVGAAAAKPSVKNGINLGHWAVQHASFEGAHAGAARTRGFPLELVIVGSGPAGLSAALAARDKGMRFVLLERASDLADTVRSYPTAKAVQVNPPHPEDPRHPLPEEVVKVGALWLDRDASREEVLERWRRMTEDLPIHYDEPVEGLRAERGGFVVSTARASYEALKVIIAVGDRGQPRRLGAPGDALPKVSYRLDDAAAYAGKHVMVVGGGNSAVEAAVDLARAGTCASVRIVYRKKTFTRATPHNRKALEALVAEGKVALHLEAQVLEVQPTAVVLKAAVAASGGEVPNDVLFTLLGSDPPTAWLKKLGIEMTKKSADWEPGPTDRPAFLQLGEPGA